MNFLDFIEERIEILKNKQIIHEGFNNSQLGKARKLIIDLLQKQTNEKIISLGLFDLVISKNNCTSELFVTKGNKNPICFTFNWLDSGKSSEVYSISFFKGMDTFFNGTGKSELTINTLGCSITYFLPIIAYVINTKDFNLQKNDATKFIKTIFSEKIKESIQYPCYIGYFNYTILEGISNKVIKETFIYNLMNNVFNEGSYEDMIQWKNEKFDKIMQASKEGDTENVSRLSKEFEEISKAIKDGASSIEEVKLAIEKSVEVKISEEDPFEKAEEEFNNNKKSPDQVFKEMEKYITMVIKGITPSVILCGAPGVGKSYRVKQLLKKHNFVEEKNLCTIKGKCTPRVLYTKLIAFKNKGQVIVIDDADGLVGPKAPEEVINILKAALDSTSDDEGRLVSYGIAGSLKDDDGNDLPKKFYYNGSVIVITNYNAGQLDTALRGRSFVQDIHFSTEDVLKIIENILPKLDPEHLSPKAKLKAFNYLKELAENKSKMEISIRTFGICAKIFEACEEDEDFNDEDARSMIKEQMELQAERRKMKY